MWRQSLIYLPTASRSSQWKMRVIRVCGLKLLVYGALSYLPTASRSSLWKMRVIPRVDTRRCSSTRSSTSSRSCGIPRHQRDN
jgi:hypothetical protein